MRIPRVLVIDDDPTIARIAKLTLRSKGYDVVVTEETHAGLIELFREKTDLILLDYMLPEQNGLSFLKEIRGDPDLSDIPVIMITTTGLSEVVQAAVLLGANDFVAKPFNLQNLIDRVGRLAPMPEEDDELDEEPQVDE
jgi:two-component system, OmpR family, phosphate regulon response regulator PhoB